VSGVTALTVQSGEADVYLQQGSLPSTSSYYIALPGSGPMALSWLRDPNFAGSKWFLLVHTKPCSWKLVTVSYVGQLPPLGRRRQQRDQCHRWPEGIRFFKPPLLAHLAWRLGLMASQSALRQNFHCSCSFTGSSTYDPDTAGQCSLCRLSFRRTQYFISVAGSPGLGFTLDSRQQSVTPLPSTPPPISGAGHGLHHVVASRCRSSKSPGSNREPRGSGNVNVRGPPETMSPASL